MKRNDIKEIIKNGGATLKADLTNADLQGGYMVSMQDYETVIELSKFDSVDEIEKTLNEYQKVSKKIGAFIGIWINDNKAYIDLSKNYKRKGNAIKIGLKNKQLGIFDLANTQTIML